MIVAKQSLLCDTFKPWWLSRNIKVFLCRKFQVFNVWSWRCIQVADEQVSLDVLSTQREFEVFNSEQVVTCLTRHEITRLNEGNGFVTFIFRCRISARFTDSLFMACVSRQDRYFNKKSNLNKNGHRKQKHEKI